MKFERATIDIRPRRILEIIDLALRFYRIHLARLLPTAVVYASPAFGVGYGLYWFFDSFVLGLVGLWLLLPLSAHAVILLASRLLFGETVTRRQLRALYRPFWFSLLIRRFFERLLWLPLLPLIAGEIVRVGYGFSPFIALLERLTGLPARLRRKSLNRDGGVRGFGFDAAVSATGAALVVALAFVADLVASDIVDLWAFGGLFEDIGTSGTKVTMWFGFVIAVSPVVDVAWFLFYLDTRIRKEGWDLELGFKTLAGRRSPAVDDAA